MNRVDGKNEWSTHSARSVGSGVDRKSRNVWHRPHSCQADATTVSVLAPRWVSASMACSERRCRGSRQAINGRSLSPVILYYLVIHTVVVTHSGGGRPLMILSFFSLLSVHSVCLWAQRARARGASLSSVDYVFTLHLRLGSLHGSLGNSCLWVLLALAPSSLLAARPTACLALGPLRLGLSLGPPDSRLPQIADSDTELL